MGPRFRGNEGGQRLTKPIEMRRTHLAGCLVGLAVIVSVVALLIAREPTRGSFEPPAVSLSQAGDPLVVYSEIGAPGLWVATREDGGWSRAEIDETAVAGSVAFDRDANPYVAFSNAAGGFLAERDLDGNWVTEQIDADATSTPAIGVDSAGLLVTVYEAGDRIRIATRVPGVPWSIEETQIAGADPALTVDGQRLIVTTSDEDEQFVASGRALPMPRGSIAADVAFRPIPVGVGPGGPFVVIQNDLTGVLKVLRLSGSRIEPDLRVNRIFDRRLSLLEPGIGLDGSTRREVFAFSEPLRRNIVVATRNAGDPGGGEYEVGAGLLPAVSSDRSGTDAFAAYWDRSGRALHGSFLDLRNAEDVTRIPVTERISELRSGFPFADQLAIVLAALGLAAIVLAGAIMLWGSVALMPYAFIAVPLAAMAARAMYLAYTGTYGLYPNDRFPLDGEMVTEIVIAVAWLSLAALLMVAVAVGLVRRTGRASLPRLKAIRAPSELSAAIALGFAIALAIGALAYVLADADGADLFTQRAIVLGDRGYVQLAMVGAGGAFLVYLASLPLGIGGRGKIAGLVALGVFLFALALSTGTRSAAIIGLAVPALVFIHLRLRPLSITAVLLAVAVMLVSGVGFRVGVRERLQETERQELALQQAEDGGEVAGESAPPITLERSRVRQLLDPIFDGSELGALDAFVLVRTEYVTRFGVDHLETAAAIATFPVPRSVWEDKPAGGMARFTAATNPGRFATTGSENTVSLAGDFYMAGRVIGLLVGFALVGVAIVLLGQLAYGAAGLLGVLVAVVVMARSSTAVWGDAYNATVGAAQVLGPLLAAFLFAHLLDRVLGKRGSGAESVPGPGAPGGTATAGTRKAVR